MLAHQLAESLNSWKAIGAVRVKPPLMMFIIGVGRTLSVESTKVAVKWDFKVVSSSTSYSDEHQELRLRPIAVRIAVKSDHTCGR